MTRRLAPAIVLLFLIAAPRGSSAENPGPYKRQVAEHVAKLQEESEASRAWAAEALGFLRAYSAEEALIERLGDESVEVRREVAMALAWCGGRKSVGPLLDALADDDWITRQAAHVSLTNLTGMELPFHGTASPERRAAQAEVWRRWWSTVPVDRPPKEVLDLLAGAKHWPSGYTVTASSTYKGPPGVLTDGQVGPEFWQTKNVPFPQWCTIDLGELQKVAEVVIHQRHPQRTEHGPAGRQLAGDLRGDRFGAGVPPGP